MLKKFYSLAIAISAIISVSAEPIDRASALAAAKAFMASRGHEVQLAQSKSLKAPRVGSTSQEPYYIFNATGNEGFVIVSGSDLTDAILGYSDHGHIDPDNMPDGLQALLANYEETIDDLDSQSAASQYEAEHGGRETASEALPHPFYGTQDTFQRPQPGHQRHHLSGRLCYRLH